MRSILSGFCGLIVGVILGTLDDLFNTQDYGLIGTIITVGFIASIVLVLQIVWEEKDSC